MTSTIFQRLPSDRRFEFASTACASDTFAVVRMSGFEAISRPYCFELVLVSDDAQLDLARVLAAKAELRILAPDGSRQATPYAGVLAEFDQLHQAGGFTFLFKAPTGVVGHVADNKVLGFSYAAADDTASLSSTGSFVSAKAGALKLAAPTIEIGNMARIDLFAAATAVVSAMETAHEAAKLAVEEAKALSQAALKAAQKSAAIQWLERPDSLLAGNQTLCAITTAEPLEKQARRNLDDALAKEADAMAAINAAPLTRGISIDNSTASLTFGNSGWKATDAGLEMKCGNSSANFPPVSVALDSQLIKLG